MTSWPILIIEGEWALTMVGFTVYLIFGAVRQYALLLRRESVMALPITLIFIGLSITYLFGIKQFEGWRLAQRAIEALAEGRYVTVTEVMGLLAYLCGTILLWLPAMVRECFLRDRGMPRARDPASILQMSVAKADYERELLARFWARVFRALRRRRPLPKGRFSRKDPVFIREKKKRPDLRVVA